MRNHPRTAICTEEASTIPAELTRPWWAASPPTFTGACVALRYQRWEHTYRRHVLSVDIRSSDCRAGDCPMFQRIGLLIYPGVSQTKLVAECFQRFSVLPMALLGRPAVSDSRLHCGNLSFEAVSGRVSYTHRVPVNYVHGCDF